MTADSPEAPTCTECGKPAQAVLHIGSLGTGTKPTVEYGEACFTFCTTDQTNWKLFIH